MCVCLSLRQGILFLLLSQSLRVSRRHRGEAGHFQLQFCQVRQGLGLWGPWGCHVSVPPCCIICYVKPRGMWERDGDHQMQTRESPTSGYGFWTALHKTQIYPLTFRSLATSCSQNRIARTQSPYITTSFPFSFNARVSKSKSVLQTLNDRVFFLKDSNCPV